MLRRKKVGSSKKKGMAYVRLPKSAYGKYLILKCCDCKSKHKIHVNHNWKEIYTKKVISTWKCWRCRGGFHKEK